jgi:hypothetical protein
MSGLFGGDSTPAPIAAPVPPSRSDDIVQSAALAARLRRAQALGRTETIVASGADEENTTTKTLLGTA